jgi:hypothetical protein
MPYGIPLEYVPAYRASRMAVCLPYTTIGIGGTSYRTHDVPTYKVPCGTVAYRIQSYKCRTHTVWPTVCNRRYSLASSLRRDPRRRRDYGTFGVARSTFGMVGGGHLTTVPLPLWLLQARCASWRLVRSCGPPSERGWMWSKVGEKARWIC